MPTSQLRMRRMDLQVTVSSYHQRLGLPSKDKRKSEVEEGIMYHHWKEMNRYCVP